jgi:hypothetical protein
VTLRTWSYDGGTNEAGQTIPGVGFDPILTLFTADGTLVKDNDDIDESVTSTRFDAYLHFGPDPQDQLPAGNYILALTMYDNFARGPRLENGFVRTGQAPFCEDTKFCDSTSDWAVDITGADSASVVPLPAAVWLLLPGLGALTANRRRT